MKWEEERGWSREKKVECATRPGFIGEGWRQFVAVSGLKDRSLAEESEGQGRDGTRAL